MSKTFKIALIGLSIATLTLLILTIFAFIGKEREYTKRILLEDKLAVTLKDKRRVEKRLTLTKKEKEEAEKKIKEIENKMEGLLLEIEAEKDKVEVAEKKLSDKEKEYLTLKEALDKERKEKLTISEKLKEIEFNYKKAKEDLLKAKSQKTKLETKISSLKESSIDLDRIVVSSETESTSKEAISLPVEPLEGKVLVVNRNYSFIVTDLGQDDGVRKGSVFDIKDSNGVLGKVEIDKVYDTMSSASLLPGSDINNVKKGNLVVESR